MSEGNNIKWGRKGSCLGLFLFALFLFIALLLALYNHSDGGVMPPM